jgi:membrane protein
VILVGAKINAEHQTKVDTTTGAPDAKGKRGARMADTLGRTPEASSPLSNSSR